MAKNKPEASMGDKPRNNKPHAEPAHDHVPNSSGWNGMREIGLTAGSVKYGAKIGEKSLETILKEENTAQGYVTDGGMITKDKDAERGSVTAVSFECPSKITPVTKKALQEIVETAKGFMKAFDRPNAEVRSTVTPTVASIIQKCRDKYHTP